MIDNQAEQGKNRTLTPTEVRALTEGELYVNRYNNVAKLLQDYKDKATADNSQPPASLVTTVAHINKTRSGISEQTGETFGKGLIPTIEEVVSGAGNQASLFPEAGRGLQLGDEDCTRLLSQIAEGTDNPNSIPALMDSTGPFFTVSVVDERFGTITFKRTEQFNPHDPANYEIYFNVFTTNNTEHGGTPLPLDGWGNQPQVRGEVLTRYHALLYGHAMGIGGHATQLESYDPRVTSMQSPITASGLTQALGEPAKQQI